MKQIIKKIVFWLNCARVYSLPITVLNWLVIYIFSIKAGGNWVLGLFALLGISLVHMATNLIDDYFDYKILKQNRDFILSAQNCKCQYLKDNLATVTDLKRAILILLGIATIIGGILFLTSGIYVALLAFLALIVAFFYQKLSLKGLGEIAVLFAYGPLMYEGVYYVMTSNFSVDVFWLSIACAFFTNTVLYAHMLMDYDGDECAHKTTLCRKFKTKTIALNFILFFYSISFISLTYLGINNNPFYFLSFLTIPLIIDLYISLKKYNQNNTHIPTIHFWHLPLENLNKIQNEKDKAFYFRFFYVRNILTYFLLIICLALLMK